MRGWLDLGSSVRTPAISLAGELHHARTTGAGGAAEPTDAAQVLAAWRQLGAGFGSALNGVYALALQAGPERLLYRDPSSLQNLFWCVVPGRGIAYASDLPDLLALTGRPPRLAAPALHEYLRFLDVAAPRTLFDGVSALEAGQLLRLHADGSIQIERPALAHVASPADFGHAVDRLDSLLQEAIALRLRGSERPALFLSSGVDSALIAAIAARVRPDAVAVTVGFDSPGMDEGPLAAELAGRLGLAHEVLRFGQAVLVDAFDRCAVGMEQPSADPSLPATVLALDHCRQRFDVVLDGTGADEAVGAIPPRHLRLAVSVGGRLPTGPRLALARVLRSLPLLGRYAPIVDFEHPADPFIRWGGFSRAEVERLCGEPVSFDDTHFHRTFERFATDAHFARYSALVDAMPCERLNQAMRVTGMRMRFPYCDRGVDSFLRHLPPDLRALPGQPKRILRALLARYLPREVWDVPKRGFNFPLLQFLGADDARLVRQHLDPERWRRRGLLDAEEVARHAHRFLAGDARQTFRVWALTVLDAWLQAHGEPR